MFTLEYGNFKANFHKLYLGLQNVVSVSHVSSNFNRNFIMVHAIRHSSIFNWTISTFSVLASDSIPWHFDHKNSERKKKQGKLVDNRIGQYTIGATMWSNESGRGPGLLHKGDTLLLQIGDEKWLISCVFFLSYRASFTVKLCLLLFIVAVVVTVYTRDYFHGDRDFEPKITCKRRAKIGIFFGNESNWDMQYFQLNL